LLVTLSSSSCADRTVDHFLHVAGVAEQERQVEDVEIVDHGAERADADAGELIAPTWACSIASFSPPSCIEANIWTLSRPLVAFLELLAEALDDRHGRITFGVNVRSLKGELWCARR
jgi:hypothetical protein